MGFLGSKDFGDIYRFLLNIRLSIIGHNEKNDVR